MIPSRTFTADDFEQERAGPLLGHHWRAKAPLDNPLGPFKVEIAAPPSPGLLGLVNDFAAALAEQHDAIFTLLHDDYRRACEDKGWMTSCGVPRRPREDRIIRYVDQRSLYVGPGRLGVPFGYVFISPQWGPEHELRLTLQHGRLVPNSG